MRKTTIVLFIAAALLNLSIFAVRIDSLVEQGHLTATVGQEGSMLYSIWKASHGYPIYESTGAAYAPISLYNYLFYEAYGQIFRVLKRQEGDLLLISRLTTVMFSALGALEGLICLFLMGRLNPRRAALIGVIAMVLFWFSSSPVGWYGIGARPDTAGIFFAELGLLLFLLYLRNRTIALLPLSSLAFFLCWSFKQSLILTFVGTIAVGILYIRRRRYLMLLVLPFAVCVLVTLYVGGPNYRFDTLSVPRMAAANFRAPVEYLFKALTENPVTYLFLPIAFVLSVFSNGGLGASEGKVAISDTKNQLSVLGIIFIIALLGEAALCIRSGSDRSYFFEAGVVGSLGVVSSLQFLFEQKVPYRSLLGGLFPGVMCVFCLIQLTMWLSPSLSGRASSKVGLIIGHTDFGRLRLLSQADQRKREALALVVAQSAKPLLISDDIFGQPWMSTNDQFPAYEADPNLAGDLLKHHVLKTTPMVTAVESRKFHTIITDDAAAISAALASGYIYRGNAEGSLRIYGLAPDGKDRRAP